MSGLCPVFVHFSPSSSKLISAELCLWPHTLSLPLNAFPHTFFLHAQSSHQFSSPYCDNTPRSDCSLPILSSTGMPAPPLPTWCMLSVEKYDAGKKGQAFHCARLPAGSHLTEDPCLLPCFHLLSDLCSLICLPFALIFSQGERALEQTKSRSWDGHDPCALSSSPPSWHCPAQPTLSLSGNLLPAWTFFFLPGQPHTSHIDPCLT